MRRLKLRLFPLIAVLLLVAACDQRPIDLGPQSTGMEWSRLVELRSGESGNDNPVVWASSYPAYGDTYVWSRFTNPKLQRFNGSAWSAVAFQPTGNYHIEIWGSGPSDVYVTDRTAHHYDGVSWTDTKIPAWHVSGSDASNVFLSSDSLVVRFNGAAWDTLLHGPRAGHIREISAYGSNGAFFAAGDSLLQWENNQWKAFKAPALAYQVVWLGDGYCAVASYDGGAGTTIWGFNGTWFPFGGPVSNYFIDDMAMAQHGSLYIANGGRLQKYIYPWWTITPPTNADLFALYGGGDSIYAVGSGGVTVHTNTDGHYWDVLRSGIPDGGYSVLAQSPSDFLIGGNHGTVYRYLSGEWTEQPLPGESSSRVIALAGAGSNRFAGTSRGSVYHFDGTNWTLSADSLYSLNDLAAASDGAAYAIGNGFIVVFDGTSWRRTYSGQDHFQHVWAHSKAVAFATAYEGVFQFDGSKWKRVLQNKQDRYQGVWGTAADDVYVAAGSIYHFDGHIWKNVFPSNSFELITGTGTDDVVASAQFGMARFDGRIWTWSPSRRGGDAIDIVPTHGGHILRMYREYLASDTPPKIVVSQRVAP